MKNKTWGLVDSFFDKYDIVDHHIKSYNDFVENRIQKIIDITEPITIENEKGLLETYYKHTISKICYCHDWYLLRKYSSTAEAVSDASARVSARLFGAVAVPAKKMPSRSLRTAPRNESLALK